MTRAKTILVIAFVLALGAGGVVGAVVYRMVGAGRAPQAAPSRSWLVDELHLSDAQHEQMHKIWSQTLQAENQKIGDRRKGYQKERDEAVLALLTPAQRAAYDQVMADYQSKVAELNKEKERAFKDAVEQTKLILSDAQKQRYEALLKERAEHGGGRNGFGMPPRSPAGGPATVPAPGPASGPANTGFIPTSPDANH